MRVSYLLFPMKRAFPHVPRNEDITRLSHE
jgi:hypothetical protein